MLKPIPAVARYLVFSPSGQGADAQAARDALARLSPLADGSGVVLGIGPALVAALGAQVPGLHEFQDFSGHGVKVPSTPGTLWCWHHRRHLPDFPAAERRLFLVSAHARRQAGPAPDRPVMRP